MQKIASELGVRRVTVGDWNRKKWVRGWFFQWICSFSRTIF
jgi:hypothetical protein